MIGYSLRTRAIGVVLACVGLTCLAPRASAQLTFTMNYAADLNTGFGFDANTAVGLERQAAVARAATYLSSVLDARGTVTIQWDQSYSDSNDATLASAGTFYTAVNGFSNGIVHQRATTNATPFSPPDGFGVFNFANNFYTGTGTPSANQFDMQSIALHELSHSLGFTSIIDSNGQGLLNNALGTADCYGRWGSFLRLGSGVNDPLILNANASYNTGNGLGAITSNNVFFSGEFSRAANAGNAVRVYSPNPFEPGSSMSHIVVTGAVMTAVTPAGTSSVRRSYLNVEMAMLIDMGWNNFTWTSTTNGNWADNVSSLTNPRWQNADAQNSLSPVGTITTDLVLRFGGTGTQQYTSTNNLTLAATPATNNDANRFLVNRMVLNSSSSNGQTIASNGTNVLRFGSTIGITPQIQQTNTGAFTISHAAELTNAGLILGGSGTGTVTMSGAIGQQSGTTGAIAKTGTSTFNLNGANTYTGATFITAGTLGVASVANGGAASAIGQSSNAADNLVLNGGTLRYTGTGHSTDRLFTLNAGGGTIDASGTGAVDFTNAGPITVANPGSIALPIVNGSLFVPVSFANGAKLSPGMTVSGTGIPGGTTVVAVGADLITLSSAATATNTAANLTFGGANRTLTLTGSNTGANRISGSLANPTGNTLSIAKSGAGSWILAGTNTYTGTTTVTAGTLTAGSPSAFGTNTVASIAGTLQTGGFNITLGSLAGTGTVENANATSAILTVGTANSSTAFSGSIRNGTGGGTLALTKVGSGTLALNGANPLTGPTTVSAGTLLVNGNIGASSAVAVNSGARLGGTGTVNGTITINAGGAIAPGTSIGTLTTGPVVFNTNGAYQFEYNRLTGGALDPGVEADRILSFADLTFNATPANPFTIQLSYIGPGPITGQAPTTAVLATFTSPPSINPAAFAFAGDLSGSASVTVIDNDLVLNFTPVPEPATIFGLTALGWLAVRVRRFGLPC
jgi:autotransporter-associated beta strand protein